MKKIAPWIITVLLIVAMAGGVFFHNKTVDEKDAQIASLRTDLVQAISDAESKIKDAEQRLTKADVAAAEKLAAADAAATAKLAAAEAVAKKTEIEAATKIQEANDQATAKVKETAAKAQASIDALATDARNRLQAANLPETTAEVAFRKAVLSNGGVAMIRNVSASSVPFTILVGRPSTRQSRQYSPVVDGGKTIEIGEREGWAFLSGDVIRVVQPGHKPRDFSFK